MQTLLLATQLEQEPWRQHASLSLLVPALAPSWPLLSIWLPFAQELHQPCGILPALLGLAPGHVCERALEWEPNQHPPPQELELAAPMPPPQTCGAAAAQEQRRGAPW